MNTTWVQIEARTADFERVAESLADEIEVDLSEILHRSETSICPESGIELSCYQIDEIQNTDNFEFESLCATLGIPYSKVVGAKSEDTPGYTKTLRFDQYMEPQHLVFASAYEIGLSVDIAKQAIADGTLVEVVQAAILQTQPLSWEGSGLNYHNTSQTMPKA